MTSPGAESATDGVPPRISPVCRPIPQEKPVMALVPGWLGRQWRVGHACLHLNRLERSLKRSGWRTERRYRSSPPLLRVFDAAAPTIGESVTAVRGAVTWSFWSSTGAYLADCSQPDKAADRVTALLAPWVLAAASSSRLSRGDGKARRREGRR